MQVALTPHGRQEDGQPAANRGRRLLHSRRCGDIARAPAALAIWGRRALPSPALFPKVGETQRPWLGHGAASKGYPTTRRARPALAKPACLCEERALRCASAAECKSLAWLSASLHRQGKLTPRQAIEGIHSCGGWEPGVAAVAHNWAAQWRRVHKLLATHHPARAPVSGCGVRAGTHSLVLFFLPLQGPHQHRGCGVKIVKRARTKV
jgi:hypothetical protein